MRCVTVQRQLSRFHDAELPPELRTDIARHLTECAQCRDALASLEGVTELWTGLERPPVPEGFSERVMLAARRRLARRPAQVAWWPAVRLWWWEQSLTMRAASAAVIVGASVVGVLLSGNPARPLGSRGAGGSSSVSVEIGEGIGFLSGAPNGSLEQTYMAWTLPAGRSRGQP